jgi:hypothetical protein
VTAKRYGFNPHIALNGEKMTNMFMKELLEDYPERPDNPFTCETATQRRERMREEKHTNFETLHQLTRTSVKAITAQEAETLSTITTSHWFTECMTEIPKAAIKGEKQYVLTAFGRSATPPTETVNALKTSLEGLGYKVSELQHPFSLTISWGIPDGPIKRG